MAADPYLRYALKKELLQTRAAAERLELRALAGRLQPGAARSEKLQRWVRLSAVLRRNPLAAAVAGAVIGRLPFGGVWKLAARAAAMGWAGYQLFRTYEDFRGK